jgi:hypothetical protein
MRIYGKPIGTNRQRSNTALGAKLEIRWASERILKLLEQKQLGPTRTWSTTPDVEQTSTEADGNLILRSMIDDFRYVYNDEGTGVYGEHARPITSKSGKKMPVPTGYRRKSHPGNLRGYAGSPPTGMAMLDAVRGAPKADWSGEVVRQFSERIREEFTRITRKVKV